MIYKVFYAPEELKRGLEVIKKMYLHVKASQLALVIKKSPANAGDVRVAGSVPGLGRSPGGGHGNPLCYSCQENPHGQRSLEGYRPWGHKESDMTERLRTHTYKRENDCTHVLPDY